MRVVFCAALLVFAGAAFGQHYEIGGDIGYGWYHNGTIYAPGGTAAAGIRNRFVAGALVGDDMYEYISGEIRYTYQDGHPFLSSGGKSQDIQGQSHAITYDMLVHLKPREDKWRPYFSAGIGTKGYVIAGPPPVPQPFPGIATMTTTDQWQFVTSVGCGLKYRATRHILLRGDFRDYITTFPKKQLMPAPNGTARGIFQQFTPMFGVSYLF